MKNGNQSRKTIGLVSGLSGLQIWLQQLDLQGGMMTSIQLDWTGLCVFFWPCCCCCRVWRVGSSLDTVLWWLQCRGGPPSPHLTTPPCKITLSHCHTRPDTRPLIGDTGAQDNSRQWTTQTSQWKYWTEKLVTRSYSCLYTYLNINLSHIKLKSVRKCKSLGGY